MVKLRREITDAEWVHFRWVDVTDMGDQEPKYMQIREHTPEEAAAVARNLRRDNEPRPRVSGWRRWLGLA